MNGVMEMDRFFCRRALAAALLILLLLPAGTEERMQNRTRPVFFSMLFPQLIPDWLMDAKAVQL